MKNWMGLVLGSQYSSIRLVSYDLRGQKVREFQNPQSKAVSPQSWEALSRPAKPAAPLSR